jgi:hypothetical protein
LLRRLSVVVLLECIENGMRVMNDGFWIGHVALLTPSCALRPPPPLADAPTLARSMATEIQVRSPGGVGIHSNSGFPGIYKFRYRGRGARCWTDA